MCLSAIYNDTRSASASNSQTGEDREPHTLVPSSYIVLESHLLHVSA